MVGNILHLTIRHCHDVNLLLANMDSHSGQFINLSTDGIWCREYIPT